MEDEPFDAMGSGGAPSPPAGTQLRKSTPSVPPAAAFGKNPNSAPAPQPPHAAAPQAAGQVPEQWKQYENDMDARRSESALGVDRSMASAAEREATRRFLNTEEAPNTAVAASETQPDYSGYKLNSPAAKVALNGAGSGLTPRQPYSMRKSASYDTDELIRKYGVRAGIPPSVNTNRSVTTEPPRSREKPGDVRQEAMKVLTLVDDHLSTPFDVRRTQSGGFRATPHMEHSEEGQFRNNSLFVGEEGGEGSPYHVTRTMSGTITSGSSASNIGGKRVPAALSGLNFSSDNRSSWKAGRYSFTDPSFRDDDTIEDDILHDRDASVIDVVTLENRALSSRANPSDVEAFDGDFPQTPSSWSSRYTDTFSSQKQILDKWDKEYENERRTNARTMFMSTASSVRSAAGSAWSEAQSQGEKVFGPGFSFRKNHVFGSQRGVEKPEPNLQTVWKDIDGESGIRGTRVHKSWQEVMLNKKKRRRVLVLIALLVLAICVVIGITASGNNQAKGIAAITADGVGSAVSFYVTSDVPYDKEEETKLNKDLINIPADAEFLVHLGNIQQASETLCPWTRYDNVATVLKDSPVPMFMLPGAEDWTNCPSPSHSLTDWRESFEEFDTNFVHGFQVLRDRVNPEAFAMLHKGVLFLGLHIVTGPVHNEAEWTAREVQMLTFYFGMTNLHKGQFRAIVLLGNARPSPQQDQLFNTIFTSLKDIQRPMAYIHANSGSGAVREYNPYQDNQSVIGVEIEDGGKNPPLKITIGFGERPFMVG
mmetsp:Transcript_53576/g.81300  ORF Transcript_53576/g.81300 Transcript_53576/m.81300 type:complete len:764 (-) Transcript_53576:103-2394(-)|eukprot:CAMPEP_0117011576 /NCGR_PEP_ID=MMETSP0472-20121206/9928_1 /TAXON_ID=693140 ORGANISM="Tiarina fusus, Strain LIS" /NCGR_SAMPLE_ID=MMETSP0472 /ASSEMBLY_ACC=CAM_ASM_000603 /LENGTH=763 /DNA_ID=CAMNT_0004714427 /DNA_START=113 /DNA_END=2404 /DNA_ORIENTATION=-